MNILLLTEFFPESTSEPVLTGGVEARTFHLVQWLSKLHRVIVWKRTSRYRFNSSSTLIFERMGFILKTLWYGFVTRERFDVVEGTNALTYPLAYLLARRTGAEAVAWIPDLFGEYAVKHLGFLNGLFIGFFEWLTLKLPWDGIIALSQETKKKVLSMNSNSRTPMSVIHGGVAFVASTSLTAKFNHPTVLTISRLVPYKRVDQSLLAVYLVRQSIPDLQLIIVGNGPEKPRLMRLARQLNIDTRIDWKSRISEDKKWPLLSRSHLHVLPSEFEGMGLVTLEALAAGTPVVNSDIPINKEVLQGEQGGLLFPKGDYVELAHAITRLLSDRTLYEQKSREAKELIKQYRWDSVNRQTEEFYEHLLSH